MQTILIACYICLQLTTSPDVKSSCDQCVTGLLEKSGISSSLEEIFASNNALKQALEEKLKAVLSQEPVISQDEKSFLEKPTEVHQISQEQADRDALIKAREEEVEKEIQAKSEEFANKLKQYKAELKFDEEVETAVKGESEETSAKIKKYKDTLDLDLAIFTQIKRDTLALDVAEIKQEVAETGHGDTLENCKALVARDSLISENEQYKATLFKSGELIITTENGTVLKKFGTANKESSDHILLIQPDCNLVTYNSGGATWATGVYDPVNGSGCYLKLDNSGNLAVYNQGQRVWTA